MVVQHCMDRFDCRHVRRNCSHFHSETRPEESVASWWFGLLSVDIVILSGEVILELKLSRIWLMQADARR